MQDKKRTTLQEFASECESFLQSKRANRGWNHNNQKPINI